MSDDPIKLVVDNKTVNDLKRKLTALKEGLPYHLELLGIMAQMTRAKYVALRKEGFTKEEALEICKGRTFQ